MPLSKEVRVHARIVGARLGIKPWWSDRATVLAVVRRELGAPAAGRKRKRDSCAVCLEERELGVLAPCGHRVCAVCYPGCKRRCPHCRASVEAFARRMYQ